MNLAENLARDFPQVVGENFTSDTKERWGTDVKILLQRRDVMMRAIRPRRADPRHRAARATVREYQLRRRAEHPWSRRQVLGGGLGVPT
jgi:hypothetical protein